jgi:TPP-dependent 2-oxoacid decarboxylase
MPYSKKSPVSLGQYLLDRLNELGVEHIFGVPGDYVIRFDKLIEQHPTIKFINTTRENTAGYAADAYARMRGLGVACITYGVGINITNALAQAFVESSPLVVISGTVGTDEFVKHTALHHLINKSISAHTDTTQLEVFKQVTIDQGVLDDPKTAAAIIDRVLTSCLQHKKPVYLEIPRNLVEEPLESEWHPFSLVHTQSDGEALEEALSETVKKLSSCRYPLIWAGHEILRFGLAEALLTFAEKNRIPIVSSLLGKTVVDESHPLFAGVYQGGMSSSSVVNLVEQCDCILILGVLMNDIDTGMFTAKLDQEHRIVSNAFSLNIGRHHYHGVNLIDYVSKLQDLNVGPPHTHIYSPHSLHLPDDFKPVPGARTTTKRVFECIQSHIRPENIVMTDVGDCLFASADLTLPQNSFIACAYFASLGFGTPGAIGAQIARSNKRVIAIVGDGGFQMTAMELSTAVRYNLDLVVIVLNNHGYGTERTILEGSYNDIVDWDYTKIPTVLRGGKGVKAANEETFDKALREALDQRGTFYLIEVELEKMDFSPSLRRLGELLGNIVKK